MQKFPRSSWKYTPQPTIHERGKRGHGKDGKEWERREEWVEKRESRKGGKGREQQIKFSYLENEVWYWILKVSQGYV